MISQIKVELANRPGTLQHMVSALAAAGIDLKALEVSNRGNGARGEACLIVDDPDKAARTLRDTGHVFELEEVLVVEMRDEVGGLAAVLGALARGEINVTQLYAFVGRVRGKSLAVLTTDDRGRAAEVLAGAGFRLFTRQALERHAGPIPGEHETTFGEHLGLDYIW